MRIRKAELGIVAAALAFAAVLVVSFRSGGRPSHGGAHGPLPGPGDGIRGQATTLLDGFDFTEESGGKPTLRIKADRTIGYGPAAGLAPDLYAGEKVVLTVYPDEGAPVVVHADRGTYDERSREAHLSGNVHWEDAQGAMAETSEGFFRPATHSLDAPKPIHFTRGSIDLAAPSARYDMNEKALILKGPIEGSGSGTDSAGLSKLTARSGVYRRETGLLELETVDGSSKSGDRYAADHVTVKTGEHGGAEWIRGVGNVRGILAAGTATPGGGGSTVERQYSGDESLLNFDAAGKAHALTFTGAPAILIEPKRRLMAPKIEMAFDDGRLASARAEGGVRVEGEDGRAEADRGTVGFSPAGESQNVVLEGSVRVQAGDRRGDAARAVELDPTGLWLLTGDGARAARVESGPSRLSADRIELDHPRNQVRGQGRARAVLAGDDPARGHGVTFVGDPKRPSYGKADRIVLDDGTQTATLSGSASVWQDDSSLFADDITLSDAQKTVVAIQNVRSVMAPDRSAKPADRAASVVTARRLHYNETERTGHFDGGVTVTRGAGWRATGGESTAWLGKDRGVDCMEISGDVDLADRAAGRTGKAEKAVDYPKQGKTLLWGNPARVTSVTGNQAAGAILTIFDRGDRVEITAPEGGKTETIHRTTEKN